MQADCDKYYYPNGPYFYYFENYIYLETKKIKKETVHPSTVPNFYTKIY